MMEALWFSSLTGAATLLGTMLVLRLKRFSLQWIACSLGLSATVMLFVSLFEMLPTALKLCPSWIHLGIGMMMGLTLMESIHCFSEAGAGKKNAMDRDCRLGWVLSLAVIAHNFPEGAAIGVGFGVKPELGVTLALAMAVHNLPEGIGMAAPLLASGVRRRWIVLISLGASGALPLGTWLGFYLLTGSLDWVAISLIFAATAMIWVVTQEVFPRAMEISPKAARWGSVFGLLFSLMIHTLHG